MPNQDIKLIYTPLGKCYTLVDGDDHVDTFDNFKDALEVFLYLCNEANDR
jgi:hypothetical protein